MEIREACGCGYLEPAEVGGRGYLEPAEVGDRLYIERLNGQSRIGYLERDS